VEKKFSSTRQQAKRAILAGNVYVEGKIINKPGALVSVEARLEPKTEGLLCVSRGGGKVEKEMPVMRSMGEYE